ncbi:hypothetical protein [Poseidonocella sedimentorum]|uniref:Uncharacterized protein n=1 Tax=Poseidonocella sedimentorum TaxID=871652 RepID=A0A1I6E9M0_9RHOB|nr:hypothetical protein [Poseidonocella sedimentorum]SFR14430.1 hypothetical protein SAMN04515673_108141 [Poseidonocella sedimentorum]
MLHEKRQDLDGERQKRLLQRLVGELTRAQPDLYYRSTSDIAGELEAVIESGTGLSTEEKSLLQRLSRRDIEVMLSLH